MMIKDLFLMILNVSDCGKRYIKTKEKQKDFGNIPLELFLYYHHHEKFQSRLEI